MLSTDSGATWNDIGQATGDPGKDGADGQPGHDGQDGADGDSFFQSIDYTTSADYVLFTLADGTQLQLPTWYAFDSLKNRCEQLNEELRTLRSLVEAVQARDAITRVETLVEDGQEVGYTLYFEQRSPINIYHGKDGADGITPQIGVRQDTDGLYYWTLNGDWLTDDSGNKVKAQGTDGADGTTPQLKIEADEYWYISYDNGFTWTKLGKATGEDGKDGQDGTSDGSFFQSVTQDDDYVYLTLASGGEAIAVPKHKPLSITFSETEDIRVLPGKTYTIRYTVTGTTDKTQVKALAQDGFRAVVKSNGVSEGTIEITTPATILSSEVLVFVTDGEERTILRSINFVEGVICITNRSYTVPFNGGTVDVELSTNIDYTVEIPAEAQSWISLAPAARAVMRDETLSFVVQPNNSTELRYATIALVDKLGVTSETILISQQGGSSQSIEVTTAGTLEQLVSSTDAQVIEELKLTGHLNTFDYEFLKTMPNLKTVDLSELDEETIPASAFSGSKVTTVLLPLNLKAISDHAFYRSAITSIDIPKTVESIGEYAFAETAALADDIVIPGATAIIGVYAFKQSALTSLTLCEGVQTIGDAAFYGCNNAAGDLIIPNSVTEIGTDSFAFSTFTGSLKIGSGLQEIPAYAFRECSYFAGNLVIGENVVTIGESAFEGCLNFTGNLIIPDKVERIERKAFDEAAHTGYLLIGSSVQFIGSDAFSFSFTIDDNVKTYCKAQTPPTFGELRTSIYPDKYLGVPPGTRELYAAAPLWSNFTLIEEVDF